MSYLQLIFPALWQLPVLGSVAIIMLMLAGLGRLVTGLPNPSLALFAGWGVGVFTFTALGTLTPIPLWAIALGLAFPALAGDAMLLKGVGEEGEAWKRAGRIMLLAAPIILLVTAMRPTEWDDFSHWIPNGAYLALHDHFSTLAAPNVGSTWPAYPYALPLFGYVSSLITGAFSERAGIIANLFLLIAAASLIGDAIAARLVRDGTGHSARLTGWGVAAASLAIVLPFNPSFSLSIGFSAAADTGTACAMAVALVVAWRWCLVFA